MYPGIRRPEYKTHTQGTLNIAPHQFSSLRDCSREFSCLSLDDAIVQLCLVFYSDRCEVVYDSFGCAGREGMGMRWCRRITPLDHILEQNARVQGTTSADGGVRCCEVIQRAWKIRSLTRICKMHCILAAAWQDNRQVRPRDRECRARQERSKTGKLQQTS